MPVLSSIVVLVSCLSILSSNDFTPVIGNIYTVPCILCSELMLKKHNKFLSTFPCNLEKKYVKNNYFHPFPPSLLVGCFVICGF